MVEPLPANPHYHYVDLLTRPESERWELIDGVAYKYNSGALPPPSGDYHRPDYPDQHLSQRLGLSCLYRAV